MSVTFKNQCACVNAGLGLHFPQGFRHDKGQEVMESPLEMFMVSPVFRVKSISGDESMSEAK